MYLHLGQDIVVRTEDIIGIFDIDNTTVSKITKNYLADRQKKGEIINVSLEDLPKSYVICVSNCDNKKRSLTKTGADGKWTPKQTKTTVYITQISCATLKKRSGFLQTISNIERKS